LAVNAQIAAAYVGSAQQLPQDALHLLCQPIETIIEYPLESKQLWLDLIQVAQQRQQQHKFSQYHNKQRLMVTWLQTATHPAPTNTTQSD